MVDSKITNEFLSFFYNQDVSITLLVFLMVFSCGIALFHKLIVSFLFDLNMRPGWLFFVLEPTIVGLSFLYRPGFALLAMVFLFASVFPLAIVGMIRSSIIKGKEDKEIRKKFEAKYQSPKKSKWVKLAVTIGAFAFIGLCIWLYDQGKLSILLVIVPVLIALDAIFLPSTKTKFYKLQAVLPTSKMNGIAMGLVEVVGDLVMTEPIISPHFKTPCIGYSIQIQEESKDNDDKITWSTIFQECKTGMFQIKDDTGIVSVNGEGLEYFIDRVDKEIQSGKKRYMETYLKNDDYIMLIGKANSDNGQTVIERDHAHKVFGAAFPHEVAIKNKFAPLYRSFLTTLFFITLLIIYIIIT